MSERAERIVGVSKSAFFSKAEWRRYLLELHRPSWPAVLHWLAMAGVFLVLTGLAGWFTYRGQYWLLIPVWLALAHVMHGHLIAFHECAHRTLAPVAWLNDLIGQLIGTLSFMSISLYRAAHHLHHAYLATEKDDELWPFTIPGTPRWFRCAIAAVELTMGLFYTPVLFLRSYLRRGSLITAQRVRRRIAAELVLVALFWTVALVAVHYLGVWTYFLTCYLVPSWLAGNIQSLRKYIEHVGMFANGPTSATRTVYHRGWFGRLIDFTWFNIPLHGVHHRFAALPQDKVRHMFPLVYGDDQSRRYVYPSYTAAFLDLLPHLLDPKTGGQWTRTQRAAA